MSECDESDCDREAAVHLDIPWDENRVVCAAHARGIATQDGVVASPIEGTEDEWPGGNGSA